MTLINHAFTKLGGHERNSCFVNKLRQHLRRHFSIAASADNDDRRFCGVQLFQGHGDGLYFWHRATHSRFRDWTRICLFVSDIFRQFYMNGARFFFLSKPVSFADTRGNVVASNQRDSVFRDRLHHLDNVENLEPTLFRFLYGLLTGDHHHRHATQLCISRCSGKICRARSKRRNTDTGLAGQAAVDRGHETCALFVASKYQLYFFRSAEAVEEIKVLFAGNTENVFTSFSFETFNKEI